MHTSNSVGSTLSPSAPPDLQLIIPFSLLFLLTGTILTSFLVPIVIALFFFTTAADRKQPIFILNIIGVLLGIVQGVLTICTQVNVLLGKPANAAATYAYVIIVGLLPVFADAILILRVLTVYPPRLLSWRTRLAIYGPMMTLKTVRIVNLIVYIIVFSVTFTPNIGNFATSQDLYSSPCYKIEWITACLGNIYMSLLFLLRLRISIQTKTRAQSSALSSAPSRRSYYERLTTLFWIATSNFVFPAVIYVVAIILAFVEEGFVAASYLSTINIYVQIIGVLLATLWRYSGSSDPSPQSGSQRSQDDTALGLTTRTQMARGTCLHCARLPRPVAEEMRMLQMASVDKCDSVYAAATDSFSRSVSRDTVIAHSSTSKADMRLVNE